MDGCDTGRAASFLPALSPRLSHVNTLEVFDHDRCHDDRHDDSSNKHRLRDADHVLLRNRELACFNRIEMLDVTEDPASDCIDYSDSTTLSLSS